MRPVKNGEKTAAKCSHLLRLILTVLPFLAVVTAHEETPTISGGGFR